MLHYIICPSGLYTQYITYNNVQYIRDIFLRYLKIFGHYMLVVYAQLMMKSVKKHIPRKI